MTIHIRIYEEAVSQPHCREAVAPLVSELFIGKERLMGDTSYDLQETLLLILSHSVNEPEHFTESRRVARLSTSSIPRHAPCIIKYFIAPSRN